MESQKDNRPKIDENLIQNGNPHLVKKDLRTDLPFDHLINNKITLDLTIKSAEQFFILD